MDIEKLRAAIEQLCTRDFVVPDQEKINRIMSKLIKGNKIKS